MTISRYNFTARILHWVVALLVVTQLVLGFAADAASKPTASWLLDQHVRLGLFILSLMLLRLLWRLTNSPPPLPLTLPWAQRWSANGVHGLIYLVLFILPLSGYVLWAWIGRPLEWFGLFPIPILFVGGEDEAWRSIAGYTHNYAGVVLMALAVIHIGAALWDEFIKGDELISTRML